MTETTASRKVSASQKEAWIESVAKEPGFTTGDFQVLVIYSMYVNGQTGLAWPSAATVAKRANLSDSTVDKALRKAKRLGYLVTVQDGRTTESGQNLPSVRRLNLKMDGVRDDTMMVDEKTPYGVRDDTPMVYESPGDGVRGCYLTPDRTPEKEPLNEPLNETPDAPGDVGDPVSVVDARGDFIEEAFESLVESGEEPEYLV